MHLSALRKLQVKSNHTSELKNGDITCDGSVGVSRKMPMMHVKVDVQLIREKGS